MTDATQTLYQTAPIETEQHERVIDGFTIYESAHALCPFCDDYVEFNYSAEGVGEATDNDCPHLVIHDGEIAKFLAGLTHKHWRYYKTLQQSHRAINTEVNAVYAVGVDPQNTKGYMVRMTRNDQCERVLGFSSRDDAAWWCIEDMVRRAGEVSP